MKARVCQIMLLLICLSMALDCATMFNGVRQDVIINSVPSNVQIWVDSVDVGKTPAFLQLTRKDDHVIRLVREGRVDATLTIESSVTVAFLANILYGGLPGCAVDLLDGASFRLSPDQVIINLDKADRGHSQLLYLPPEDREKIRTLKFNHGEGDTELLLNVTWVD